MIQLNLSDNKTISLYKCENVNITTTKTLDVHLCYGIAMKLLLQLFIES